MNKITEEKLKEFFTDFRKIKILVVGDYFLDKYLFIDRQLSETSLETGLEAYQCVTLRSLPGGAGTVAKDLAVLGVQTIALTVVGDDGEGLELVRALRSFGVDVSNLTYSDRLHTPVYMKPVVIEPNGQEIELNRIDIKNRKPIPSFIEQKLISKIYELIPQVDGVALVDQVGICGVITENLLHAVQDIAANLTTKIFIADSRTRIKDFKNFVIKPNYYEAVSSLGMAPQNLDNKRHLWEIGRTLHEFTNRPLYITLAEQGIFWFGDKVGVHVAAVPVQGPIDPVGAGDAVMAGLASALCAGADYVEAAQFAMLVAGVTIQKLRTTGEAAPDEILSLYSLVKDFWPAPSRVEPPSPHP